MRNFFNQQGKDRNLRPPDLYEYFVDNHWFKTIDLENQKINEPLRGSHKADVIIIGGGYTGLSSAYNIKQKFPEKKSYSLREPAVAMGPAAVMADFVSPLSC